MSLARRITTEIFINSKDITKNISPYLLSVSVSDVLDGETNSATIELEDRERLWVNDWFPQRGDTVKISFTRQNWSGNNEVETFSLDNFEVDEIENKFPPNTCTIKLNSVASSSGLKSSDFSRSWEQTKLSKICSDIAADAGLELFFDSANDPEISRAEQKNESNLKFLHELAKKHGLILRVSEKQLILCDEEKLESAESVKTFSYGDTKIKSFSGRATLSEIYSSAEVEYSHGKKKETFKGKFEDATKPGGKTLKIKKKVSSQTEADDLAKKSLRDKNKKEIEVRLEVIGDFCFLSGNVVELDKSFGFYKGNYIIERADWKVGSGFTCNLDLRKCLVNY